MNSNKATWSYIRGLVRVKLSSGSFGGRYQLHTVNVMVVRMKYSAVACSTEQRATHVECNHLYTLCNLRRKDHGLAKGGFPAGKTRWDVQDCVAHRCTHVCVCEREHQQFQSDY
jgi:hypothetical protein